MKWPERTKVGVLLMVLAVLCLSQTGCATVGAVVGGVFDIMGGIIGGTFKILGKVLDVIKALPKPPPGVF